MPAKPLDDEVLWQAVEAYHNANCVKEYAAQHLGLASSTFTNRLKMAVRRFGEEAVMTKRKPAPGQYDEIQKPVEPEEPLAVRQEVRYKDQIKFLKAEIRRLREEVSDTLTYDELRHHIFKIADKPIPKFEIEEAETPGDGFPGVPIAMLSDLHFGEVVNLHQMDGANQYNAAIAEARLQEWVNSLIALTHHYQKWQGEYPGLVLCLGGDMISGDIHKELAETNDLPTMAAVIKLASLLEACIEKLADKFGKVMLPCVVGNHGRNVHKPQAKNNSEVNFETILYFMLMKHFQNDDRVTFIFPNNTLVHFDVYRTKYTLTHGDKLGVKGGDGIIGAIGPIMRGTFKTLESENSGPAPRTADRLIMGHWHTAMEIGKSLVNGSLKGWDEYARDELRTKYEPPIQILWYTHPTRGVIGFTKIHCDSDMRALRPEPPRKSRWFDYPQRYDAHWEQLK